MAQRIPYVGGNWKMNTDRAGATALAEAVLSACGGPSAACHVVVCPPFPSLQVVGDVLRGSGIVLGAQNVYPEPDGAFTGEVSCSMLRDCGVATVICGHSERRHVIGETDELINRKVLAALDAGLEVILCVGETLQQREAGHTDAVNAGQLTLGLAGVSAARMSSVVIAYEPVWAIGTGRTASPEDAQAAHRALRDMLGYWYGGDVADSIRILYGGSVKPDNAADLFGRPDIDGGLIGGASLKADQFGGIVGAAAERAATVKTGAAG